MELEAALARIKALEGEIGGLQGATAAERTKRQAAEAARDAAIGQASGFKAQVEAFGAERAAFGEFKAQAALDATTAGRFRDVVSAGFGVEHADTVRTIAKSLYSGEGTFADHLAAQKTQPWAQGYLSPGGSVVAPAVAPAAPAAEGAAPAAAPAAPAVPSAAPGGLHISPPIVAAPIPPAPAVAAGTLPVGAPGGAGVHTPGSIVATAKADPGAFLKAALGPGYKVGRYGSNGVG